MDTSEKLQEEEEEEAPIVFYNSKEEPSDQNNMIFPLSPQPPQPLTEGGLSTAAVAVASSHNSFNPPPPPSSAPKKRAETWVQEETRALVSLRREIDLLFNTSKSNKHLWDSISLKMREKGFDRSPAMCTDKWRNLLKEYKKAKQNDGNGLAKMNYHKDIEEILRERSKNEPDNDAGDGGGSKVDSFMQFADKGIDDASLTFGPVEDNGRSTLNLERRNVDHEEHHPLAITAADAVGASEEASPWNWRDTPGNAGEQSNTYDGRVITVKLGEYTKRISIDGTAEAIKESIKSAFRIRTRRAFWLEDEDDIVRALDRDMPLGNYTLHVDEGVTVKVCFDEESDNLPVHTEEKTFYAEEDFRDFLRRHRWICLREYNGLRNVDSMEELRPGVMYRGVNQL